MQANKVSLIYILWLLILQSSLVTAETIVFEDKSTVSGRIGELSDDIVKFYGEGYFAYPLNTIRDIEVDGSASSEERDRQEKNVLRLRQVIDQEVFLKTDLTRQVNTLLLNREFGELDRLAKTLRDGNQRFPSGRLKEAEFYYGVDRDLKKANVEYFRKRMVLVDEWISTTNSETANIASMHLASAYAWAYRGGGYANTVTKESWKKFSDILSGALNKGERLLAEGTQNPLVYAKLIHIYKTRKNNNQYINKLAIEGARLDPYYYGLHEVTLTALLPKWGGSVDEVKTYVQRVHEKYGRIAGKEDVYFRLVLDVFEKEEESKFPRYKFYWSRVETSFTAYISQYPVTEFHYYSMAKMAGAFGDREGVKKYLSLTSGQWNHFAKSVWKKKATLERFQQWANEEESPEFSKLLTSFLLNTFPVDIDDALRIYVLSGGNLDKTDVYGDTPLHHAINNNNIEFALKLLALGADPEKQDRYGRNSLYIATSLGRTRLVDQLLKAGVDVTGRSSSGRTVAYIAAGKGFTALLEKFIALDSSLLNSKTVFNSTPLHRAATKGYTDTVKRLLEYPEIDVDAQDNHGYTPLHRAVSKNHIGIVSALVEHGVNTAISTTKYNYTALNLAEHHQLDGLVDYLRSVNAVANVDIVSKVDRDRAVALYDEAGAYFKPGQYQKALSLIKEAIAANPNYAVAHHGMANLHLYHLKDAAAAEKYILQTLAIDPNNAESYYTAGRVYYAMGDIAKSKPFFQQYVKKAPDTYNTQDLKNNYRHLLGENNNSVLPTDSLNITDSLLFKIDQHRQTIVTVLILFIILLLLIRQRKKHISTHD